MPAPQPGTTTAVVFTDLKAGARFGIEGHSVLAATVRVKPQASVSRSGGRTGLAREACPPR